MMLSKIEINNFKCFSDVALELKPLTLITGTNSSGKSSVLQAILLAGKHKDAEITSYLDGLGNFDDLKNKHTNPREYSFNFSFSDGEQHIYTAKKYEETAPNHTDKLAYPTAVTYLNANRNSLGEINNVQATAKNVRNLGIDGKYVASYFQKFKNEPIENELIMHHTSLHTLEGQVNYWLKRVASLEYELHTEEISSSSVKASYKSDGLEFKPANVGIGISYMSAIIISCLSAKLGEIIIIENPEIHLHPKAQSNLAEFLAFISSKGIQLIIETHNDHIINRIRYEVFKQQIASESVIIHYKNSKQPFQTIRITDKGKFVGENGANEFPSGFYDATLQEIFKINMGR